MERNRLLGALAALGLLLTLVGCGASSEHARTTPVGDPGPRRAAFDDMDVDQDATVTSAEFYGAIEGFYDDFDANQDGRLDHAETANGLYAAWDLDRDGAIDESELGRAVVSFTLGGLGGVGWPHVRLALPLVGAGLIAAYLWGRPLDLLLSGDEEASTLGVDVTRARRWSIIWVAVLTAAAVALGGNIAFVGLVVPHALRPFVGSEHRRLVPAALLGGGVFLGACDLLARALPTQTEVPLGVVTGILGAPLFLLLLLRSAREEP